MFGSESSPYQLTFQQLAAEIQQAIVDNAESAAAIRMSDLRVRSNTSSSSKTGTARTVETRASK